MKPSTYSDLFNSLPRLNTPRPLHFCGSDILNAAFNPGRSLIWGGREKEISGFMGPLGEVRPIDGL